MFGSTTPVGSLFKNLLNKNGYNNIFVYSRKPEDPGDIYYDMENPSDFIKDNFEENSVIISFAPIWNTSFFLSYLQKNKPKIFKNVEKILVCSSSSCLTKRFAFNSFDQKLFLKLKNSEELIFDLSTELNIKCLVIQPALVYGSVGNYKDRNFSKLLFFMRLLPVLILPTNTGLRQPISCYQLANVFFNLLVNESIYNQNLSTKIVVGGDKILSYKEMLKLIQNSTKANDLARKCLFLTIPDWLFIIIASPVVLYSKKIYESVLRIFANLSGFTLQSKITNQKNSTFPHKFENR